VIRACNPNNLLRLLRAHQHRLQRAARTELVTVAADE